MPRSNRGKIKDAGTPSIGIRQGASPDSIMQKNPSWSIAMCDVSQDGNWSFRKERLVDTVWEVIFPKLRLFEKMTWTDILVKNKKQNHSIPCDKLNRIAQKRLEILQIETDELYSLRLSGNVRIYGVLIEAVFYILWYDDNHGNNDTCVCRSILKHT